MDHVIYNLILSIGKTVLFFVYLETNNIDWKDKIVSKC